MGDEYDREAAAGDSQQGVQRQASTPHESDEFAGGRAEALRETVQRQQQQRRSLVVNSGSSHGADPGSSRERFRD